MMNINLPSLKGTEKQVAWAEKIRTELLQMIDEEIADELSSPVTVFWAEEGLGAKRDEVLKVARDRIAAQESSAWWIKHKDMNHHNLFYYLVDIYREG